MKGCSEGHVPRGDSRFFSNRTSLLVPEETSWLESLASIVPRFFCYNRCQNPSKWPPFSSPCYLRCRPRPRPQDASVSSPFHPVLLTDTQLTTSPDAKRQEGAPTPSELQEGALWVRGVTDPHFHDYLQTTPQNSPGPALLGPAASAGQYNVENGQLVSLGDPATPLYLHIEQPDDLADPPRALAATFAEAESEFGEFVFNGDALTWNAEGMTRENDAAWLVCEGGALFVNTGAYGYQTPEGCSDHTVSFMACWCFRSLGRELTTGRYTITTAPQQMCRYSKKP